MIQYLLEYILSGLVIIGLAFNILGVIGLLRFPDVYTRLHATTKCTTFGSIFIYAAVVVYGYYMASKGNPGFSQMANHTLIALAALLITNPTGAHAIAQAAYRSGTTPKYAVVDRLASRESRQKDK